MGRGNRTPLVAGAGVSLLTAIVFAATCVSALAASSGAQEVDLKLVLATDVSRSIDDDELLLERQGTADAFLDADVIKAIQSGALGRIAVVAFDFSSPEDNQVTVDWKIIHDRTTAEKFAAAVRNAPRSYGRRTSISGALEMGSILLESSENVITASRRMIDVSGDGPNNDGNPMTTVHDRVVGQGIVVNGLPVMDDQANGYFPELDKYYAACVAGGTGSFVVVVRSYKDFTAAMRHKLILEISGDPEPHQQAGQGFGYVARLIPVAQIRRPSPAPEVLHPGKNEFSGNCDIQGAFGFGGFRHF
jgi:Protein of unknown function (DUF1194)